MVRPLTTLDRLEIERLTEDNGFGLPQGEVDGFFARKYGPLLRRTALHP